MDDRSVIAGDLLMELEGPRKMGTSRRYTAIEGWEDEHPSGNGGEHQENQSSP